MTSVSLCAIQVVWSHWIYCCIPHASQKMNKKTKKQNRKCYSDKQEMLFCICETLNKYFVFKCCNRSFDFWLYSWFFIFLSLLFVFNVYICKICLSRFRSLDFKYQTPHTFLSMKTMIIVRETSWNIIMMSNDKKISVAQIWCVQGHSEVSNTASKRLKEACCVTRAHVFLKWK